MGADEYLKCIGGIQLELVDLLGSGYVIEYCASVYSNNCQQQAFRNYVADGIMSISKTLADYYGGAYLTTRLSEIGEPEDERTGDEIALDVITRAGLIVR